MTNATAIQVNKVFYYEHNTEIDNWLQEAIWDGSAHWATQPAGFWLLFINKDDAVAFRLRFGI